MGWSLDTDPHLGPWMEALLPGLIGVAPGGAEGMAGQCNNTDSLGTADTKFGYGPGGFEKCYTGLKLHFKRVF